MKRESQSWDELEPLFAELREQVAGAEAETVDPALYAGVLDSVRAQARLRLVSEHDVLFRGEPAPPVRRRSRLVALGGVAALASAAAFALGVGALQRSPEPAARKAPAPAVTPSEARSELALASGDVQVGGREAQVGGGPLKAGERVSTRRGRACVVIDPQVDVCLDADTEIVLDSLAETDIRLRVLRGTAVAALAPRAPGRTFSLSSGDVLATARGTVFAVAREGAGATNVVVVEGHVEVSAPAQAAELLPAHSRLALAAGVQSPRGETALVGRSEEARLLALIAPRALWQTKALGMLEVAAGGQWLEASLEDLAPLALPLRAFVPTGSHRVVLRDAAGAETSVDVQLTGGQTRRVEVAAASTARSQGLAPESAADLLETARRELARGGAKAALPLYQRLLTTHPKSPEAFTVLVTVGQLELDQHAPAKALGVFDAYLRRGGSLAPEALAGKIRALRALGRVTDERAAIVEYLRLYPSGFAAETMRRRLEAMQ